jgi:DNA-binding transcriptional regulator YdaS (Cro superfamily)
MNTQVNKALRAAVKAAGSQNKAAVVLGISSGLITRLLKGERQAGRKVLKTLGFETKLTKLR